MSSQIKKTKVIGEKFTGSWEKKMFIPEIIYTQATQNRLMGIDLYIYAYVCASMCGFVYEYQ